MKRLVFEGFNYDRIDTAILRQLMANGRLTTAELARRVRLSAPSVTERIKRLEEAGIITGYKTTVSMEAMGLPMTVWIRIRPVPGEMNRVAEIVQSIPEITRCDRITGEDCFLARAHVATISEMERVIDQLVPYARTNTSIVQSSTVEERLPPLPLLSDEGAQ